MGGGPSNTGPDLAVGGTRLWVAFPTGMQARAVALNASDLSTTGEEVGGPNSLSITLDGNDLWVSKGATLECVDAHGGTLSVHPIDSSVTGSAALGGTVAYVNTGTGLAVIARGAGCRG